MSPWRRLLWRRGAQSRVDHGAVNPGCKLPRLTHRAWGFQQFEEDPLAYVFRLGQLTRNPIGDPHEPSLPATDQNCEGLPVAALERVINSASLSIKSVSGDKGRIPGKPAAPPKSRMPGLG